jgi:cysteinyl-tRNA synthetase
VDPGAVRLLMFQTHYRQKMDLTDEALAAAREGSRRLGDFDRRLAAGAVAGDCGDEWRGWGESLERRVRDALDDDLNAPQAVAALFDVAREGNRLLDQGSRPGVAGLGAWARTMGVFDVLPAGGTLTLRPLGLEASGELGAPDLAAGSDAPPADPAAAETWALAWARARLAAKGRRDYKEADRIRELLRARGWEVRDGRDGSAEVRRADG